MSLNNEIKKVQDELSEFARQRDWEQFHSAKNIAAALTVEASELLEVFQWLTEKQSMNLNEKQLTAAGEEIADVFLYTIKLADILGLNLEETLKDKMIKNREKYPVDKVKGSSKKYSEYGD